MPPKGNLLGAKKKVIDDYLNGELRKALESIQLEASVESYLLEVQRVFGSRKDLLKGRNVQMLAVAMNANRTLDEEITPENFEEIYARYEPAIMVGKKDKKTSMVDWQNMFLSYLIWYRFITANPIGVEDFPEDWADEWTISSRIGLA